MIAGLDARTRAAFPDEPHATHLDYVELWQASGHTLNELADELTALPTGTARTEDTDTDTESEAGAMPDAEPAPPPSIALGISSEMLSRYLTKTFGAAEVSERLTRARERGAHRMADETLSIADAKMDKDDVPAARLQVAARQWVASKWNPAEFGQSRNLNIGISVTQMHLQALQHVSNTVTGASKIAEIAAHNTTYFPRGNGQVVVTPMLTESGSAASSDNGETVNLSQ